MNIKARYRLFRKLEFRYLRILICAFFRLWVKKIYNSKELPINGPCIIVSNHSSYFDWIVLSAIYGKKYVVFMANKELLQRPIINFLIKLNILIYVDKNNPGFLYFREAIRRLKQGYILIIYPEGTRSRSGKLIEPKLGFVKLAHIMNVPIIPLGIRGAYEILPPQKVLPKFKRCEMYVGNPINVNTNNKLFEDIFKSKVKSQHVSKDEMKEMSYRIMDIIGKLSNQTWDSSVLWKANTRFITAQNAYLRKIYENEKNCNI